MDKPPLVCRTRVITPIEDTLIEAQRDADVRFYEPVITRLEEESEARRQLLCRLTDTNLEQRKAGRREVLDWIYGLGRDYFNNPLYDIKNRDKLKEWGIS